MNTSDRPVALNDYRARPGAVVDLRALNPGETGAFRSKKEGRAALKALTRELDRLQRILWADGTKKLLVVLQAMDSGGKDGTIRRVFGHLNPQGVTVTGFKVPTARELAHDYLWRVHRHTPGSGEIAVFNRSHYEDVLVVRVLGLVESERWAKRYDHISSFERLLADEGTTILKFFLNVSKTEQRLRLQARLDDPEKRWKFNAGDLEHREMWDEYMAAYETAISRTTAPHAPWFVVPADVKWYRDVVVATAVVEALTALNMRYPDAEPEIEGIQID